MKNLVFVLALSLMAAPQAKVNFIEAMVEEYPSVMASPLMDCQSCHLVDKWQRDHYGLDLQEWLRANYDGDVENPSDRVYAKEFIQRGMEAIEDWDSDGDGYSNAEEFEALSFPGNRHSNPAAQ